MKFGYILMLTVATVVPDALAFVCPDAAAINYACRQLNVFPLVCYDPERNVQECNAKQCNQPYIDNYSTCQCRRSLTDFYASSRNVGGLIRRCGGGFTNPYGDWSQYRPGQGTATFPTSATATGATGAPGSMTRIYNGTTYYGGQTGVVSGTTRIVSATAVVGGTTIFSGTTTWVSQTPGIVSGSSSPAGSVTSDRLVNSPTQTSGAGAATTDNHISGGSIAGIVLGLLGVAALAALLALWWRTKRKEHLPATGAGVSHGPTRTVITEKVEPVVVRTDAGQAASGSGYGTGTGGYNPAPRP